jgi:hypothetical protein
VVVFTKSGILQSANGRVQTSAGTVCLGHPAYELYLYLCLYGYGWGGLNGTGCTYTYTCTGTGGVG